MGVEILVALVISLLLVAAITLILSKLLGLSFTILLVLVGVGLSYLKPLGLSLFQPLVEYTISPEMILFVFLPTLIFESALNLDARRLKENLAPVLALAIPGLLLSTVCIGGFLALVTDIPFAYALLLGAILSATDPVAVISLFKKLGTPRRLTLLVEGESLFNDATSIVLSKILLSVALAGYLSWKMITVGFFQFLLVFLGGIFVGWIMAVIVGGLLQYIENDSALEITLTTLLAYGSFLVAEGGLHLSGVMATVAAGVTMGSWGQTKISPAIEGYLKEFWEYMAFLANALIFLLVGLSVNLDSLASSLPLLGWVILAMLLSRALVIYGLLPLVSFLPPSPSIDRKYQTVMYWGGLRGAIALALILEMQPELAQVTLAGTPLSKIFLALVIGAVLFTLVVQGLTIEWLVKKLGLHKLSSKEELTRVEWEILSHQKALEKLPQFLEEGFFSRRVEYQFRNRYKNKIYDLEERKERLEKHHLTLEEEKNIHLLQQFAQEKSYCFKLFEEGLIGEDSYRDLAYSLTLQSESLRHRDKLPDYTLYHPRSFHLTDWVMAFLKKVPFLSSYISRWKERQKMVREYEIGWARYESSRSILADIEEMGQKESLSEEIIAFLEEKYQSWRNSARDKLSSMAEQFPEFVQAVQERLVKRMMLFAEREVVREGAQQGAISTAVERDLLKNIEEKLDECREVTTEKLNIEVEELLREVPFLKELSREVVEKLGKAMEYHTLPEGEKIISKGEEGDSMYLLARGVVSVIKEAEGEGEKEKTVGTLLAGDFFGEHAVLHGGKRTATCRTLTPCALYELNKKDFEEISSSHPQIKKAVEKADRSRSRRLPKEGEEKTD